MCAMLQQSELSYMDSIDASPLVHCLDNDFGCCDDEEWVLLFAAADVCECVCVCNIYLVPVLPELSSY